MSELRTRSLLLRWHPVGLIAALLIAFGVVAGPAAAAGIHPRDLKVAT